MVWVLKIPQLTFKSNLSLCTKSFASVPRITWDIFLVYIKTFELDRTVELIKPLPSGEAKFSVWFLCDCGAWLTLSSLVVLLGALRHLLRPVLPLQALVLHTPMQGLSLYEIWKKMKMFLRGFDYLTVVDKQPQSLSFLMTHEKTSAGIMYFYSWSDPHWLFFGTHVSSFCAYEPP